MKALDAERTNPAEKHGMRRSVALFAEWRLDMCIKELIVLHMREKKINSK